MALLNPQLWPEQEWRSLSEALELLDATAQRKLARHLVDQTTRAVLAEDPIAHKVASPVTKAERLRDIEHELDEAAWMAQDAGDEELYRARFRQARCASAAIASRDETASAALSRTAYEARHALNDDGAFRRLMET